MQANTYTARKGAELYFKEGVSPYDDRVGEASQRQIYGRLAEPDEDQVLYAYPFYAVFYIGPLAFLNYQLAATIYIFIMFCGLLLTLALSLHLLRWLPSPPMLAALVLWTVVAYFSVRGLLLAQLAIIGYVGHIVALWAIFQKRETLAGLALTLSTIKPQTGFLIVPLLLIWAWRTGRRGIVISFALSFGAMCGISFLLQPSWLGDWLHQISAYQNYTETVATAEILTHFIDGIPEAFENLMQVILIIALAIPVLRFWKKSLIDNHHGEFLWGYFLTMTFSLMVAPRTATTYYVELYPVLGVTAMILSRKRQSILVYVPGLILLIGYWALHIATVPEAKNEAGGLEAPVVYVVFPVIILTLLLIYRRDWTPFSGLIKDNNTLPES